MSTIITKLYTNPNLRELPLENKEILINRLKDLEEEGKNDILNEAIRTLENLSKNNKLEKVYEVINSNSIMEAKLISTLLSSNDMVNSEHLDEMIKRVRKSKMDDNNYLAVRVSCFPSVINSEHFKEIVDLFEKTKNVGQVCEGLDFLSRHREKIANPDYVINIDTLRLIMASENHDQALYRSEMAAHLTKEGIFLDEMHKFMSLIQSNNSFNQYSSLMGIHLNLDEVTRTRLIDEICGNKEPYKIDYILQYTNESERYDNVDKLKSLANFMRDISVATDKESAEKIYRKSLKVLYEIPSSVDTLEYPWGELRIVKYNFDTEVISKNTAFNGKTLLPGSSVTARTKELIKPKMKGHH